MPPPTAESTQKIVIGCFGAPFGIQGWLHIVVFGRNDSFLHNTCWWCAPAAADLSVADSWRHLQVEKIRSRGRGLLAKLAGIDERGQAEQWTNGNIAIDRGDFSPVAADEYYWCDLLGLQALDLYGAALGRVVGLMRSGAHDIIRIAPDDKGKEILVPFVEAHVGVVDVAAGLIRLHWRRDW